MQPDLAPYLHPSPVMEYDLFEGITFQVKRDDLIHPDISGNKWRKLKYNVLKAYESGCDTLLTFGGAFSNHLLATAKTAQLAGFSSIGIIRGEYTDEKNPTLSELVRLGMRLIKVPVSEYNERNNYHYLDQLRLEFPGAWIIPEGGANYEGVLGCTEILREINQPYDVVACAVGTGTTAAGLVLSNRSSAKIACFSVFKEAGGLRSMIEKQMDLVLNDKGALADYQNDIEIIEGYHFGGYAKVDHTLKTFAREIYQRCALPLDLVYTAKLLYGISDLVQSGRFSKGSRILMYHSGGLQGNKGFDFNLDE